MGGTRASVAGSLLLVLAALACPGPGAAPAAAPAGFASVGDERAVGKNHTGEECRLRHVEREPDRRGFERFALHCEGWTQPSGEIRRFRTGRAEALRRAQLVLAAARETSHPFYWAPFVLVGDGGAVAP